MNVKCLQKPYQRATIQSVQIDGEIKSMTEDQGIKNLTEATTKAEAAEQLFEEARERLARHQATTGRRWSLVLFALLPLFVLLAKAQTTGPTYVITPGTICNSGIEGCYYENLMSTLTDGSAAYGRFEAGGYWTQFQYEASKGQNPGYKAQYCNGTGVWNVTMADPTHGKWTMDCNASPDQTSSDGPVEIHADITAHKISFTEPCGRWLCHISEWIVDEGSVTLTQLSPAGL